MDYKLTITFDDTPLDLQEVAEKIVAEHGENFDAARGDFTVSTEDSKLVILAKDVARGDMRMLAHDIENEYGDLTCNASRRNDGESGWFSDELEDDD